MQDEQTRWDDRLAMLENTVRSGDNAGALEQLIAFDAELTRYVRGEERVLFPVLERFTSVSVHATASMRNEHRSLRRILDTIGELLVREDRRRGLDLLATLRSVLLLHVAKEEWVLYPLMRPVTAHPHE
jgi:iron-sulfur cluster repair protein YtfE (RIC family)